MSVESELRALIKELKGENDLLHMLLAEEQEKNQDLSEQLAKISKSAFNTSALFNAASAEVAKSLEDKILGQEANVNLEKTGKVLSIGDVEELITLRAKLDELSRHCVYGFYNKDKQLMYVGQTTDFNLRVSEHLDTATGKIDQSKAKPFHKALEVELKHGVYTIPLFKCLDELQANDEENALILALKETECCENVADGRWTDRFSALTHAECKLEIDTCYAKALHLIQGVSEDQLVTLANYEARFKTEKLCANLGCTRKTGGGASKCPICLFIKQKDVECKRIGCEKLGVGAKGYCWSCYKYNAKRINANETLLPLNTERSVALKNGGYNNGFQRSLVLSMQTLGGAEISRKVKSMFPTIKMVDKKTINEWIRDKIKKVENADNLAKFLRANQKTYTGLTSDMVDHLLIYEHSITNDVKEASERLSKLFYCTEDKDKFAESIVQNKYANIESIKQSLKRAATDEDKPDVETKKSKVE